MQNLIVQKIHRKLMNLQKNNKKNNLIIKSLTLDNRIEFERIGILAKQLNFKVYQCDPYASFQREFNEHLNGMIHRT